MPDRLEGGLGSDPADPDDPFEGGDLDLDDGAGPGPDALPDGLERYLVASGARAPVTGSTDTDGDGVPDHAEVACGLDFLDRTDPHQEGRGDADDSTGPPLDGISDGLEIFLIRRGAAAPVETATDSDRDGIEDVLEVRSGTDPFRAHDPRFRGAFDLDRDGLPDAFELALGSDALDQDRPVFHGAGDDDGGANGPDGDGITDGLESWLIYRGARPPVTTFTDSDGDGIPDYAEVLTASEAFDADDPLEGGGSDSNNATGPAGDGISDALEALLVFHGAAAPVSGNTESDGDGVPDFVEIGIGTDPFGRVGPAPFGHPDLDGDGVPDFLELQLGSDPLDADSPLAGGGGDADDATGPDDGRISDAMEAVLVELGARPPVTTLSDTDLDGVPDFLESVFISDLADPDSPLAAGGLDSVEGTGPSGDGVSDALERVLIELGAAAQVTRESDSDDDAVPDVVELRTATDPMDAADPAANAHADVDADGAPDYLELVAGSDPFSALDPLAGGAGDDDADRLSNALEFLLELRGSQAPVEPESDTDGDGLFDYLEVRLPSYPYDGDHPAPGGGDANDATGPGNDALSDALELYLVESGARAPVTARSDSDRDGAPDSMEVRLVFDAFDADDPLADGGRDSDQDLLSDALELCLVRLGASAPVDARTDSDADGAPDHLEVLGGSDPFDAADPAPGGGQDGDGDGISDGLELVLLANGAAPPITPQTESDRDGIPDAYEVRLGAHPFDRDHPLVNGGIDVDDASGPAGDTITDGLESVLIAQGVMPPVGQGTETDLDGAPDYLEVFALAGVLDGDDPVPGGGADLDGDHLSAALEEVLERFGASPPFGVGSDSDRDGAPDYFEVAAAAHPVNGDDPVHQGAGESFDADDGLGPAGDGISDALELLLARIGVAPPVAAWTETDGDGLPDYFEVRAGTNPLDDDDPTPDGGLDLDDSTGPGGDGISDALERYLIARGASGPITESTDSDGDGAPDWLEVFRGTDPFDPASSIPAGEPPAVSAVAITGPAEVGGLLLGTYAFADPDGEPEGDSLYRWLRDDAPIAGESGRSHVVSEEDIGSLLTFEVTPVSAYPYPPESAAGAPGRALLAVAYPGTHRGVGGPAGIVDADGTGPLRFWVRADAGVVVASGSLVDAWQDQSGYRVDAAPVDDGKKPLLVTGSGPKLAPAIRFGGTQALKFERAMENGFTVVVASLQPNPFSDPDPWKIPALVGEATPDVEEDFRLGAGSGEVVFALHGTIGTPLVQTPRRARALIFEHDPVAGTIRLFSDGELLKSKTVVAGPLTEPDELTLGCAWLNGGFLTTDIYEVAIFDSVLTDLERDLVQNYFVGRFGVALTPPPLVDFLDTHGGELAAIWREGEKAVVASEGIGLVRISAPSALSAGDRLIWGTDAPGSTELVPGPFPYAQHLRRTWAYQIRDGGDGVGTVSMSFDLADFDLSTDPLDYAVLIDDDGDFTDARPAVADAFYDPTNDTANFLGVDLAGGRFFALAVR